MEQKKKLKIVIIVLAVLLGISLSVLGGTLLYNKLVKAEPATVTVPDNLITPEEDTTKSEESAAEKTEGTNVSVPAQTTKPAQSPAAEMRQATSIRLFNRQAEENKAFQVGNLFPGDAETKYFRVQVSYHNQVTVHYKATVRPGCEKLAEVLKVKVKLLTTGETVYDGLMRDMPESIACQFTSQGSATDELYYEITAYLDTSVGNAYQNKDLIADFTWWVEETGNLDSSPETGDISMLTWWTWLAIAFSSALIVLLYIRRRKEVVENG